MKKIIKIGHRGACAYEPENTLRSFAKAIELQADMIELDVRLSSDGQLFVIHDESLERTTNGTGYVFDKTFDELKSFDAGKGEKIPLLREALDLVNKKIAVNIELKDSDALEKVLILIEEYVTQKGWLYENFIISSFNHYDLWKIKNINPQIRIGALAEIVPVDFVKFAKEMKAYSVHVKPEFVEEKFVNDMHENEMKIFVYTLNDPNQIEKMKSLSIDGIFSDFPDRL